MALQLEVVVDGIVDRQKCDCIEPGDLNLPTRRSRRRVGWCETSARLFNRPPVTWSEPSQVPKVQPNRKSACQFVAMSQWTSLEWLPTAQQKTLIFSRLYDNLIPPVNQGFLAKQIPNAELRVFAAGHLPMYSRRKEIATSLPGFITGS